MDLADNSYFSGICDTDLMKLIRLRDKVSQDVLEQEFY
jgi:hypothetical protein